MAHEVADLVDRFALRPTAITSYLRRAWVGGDYDPGVRVTFDHDLRYRLGSLDLAHQVPGSHLLPPDRVVAEVKVNDRVPAWLTRVASRHDLTLVRISKYCAAIDAGGHPLSAERPGPAEPHDDPTPIDLTIPARRPPPVADMFDFEDLTGTFSVADVTLTLVVSFAVCAWIGWVYRATHHGVSYSKSFVQTLVVMGMCVSVVMLVVGSNIARAFSLVGALSIIRFRNALKETARRRLRVLRHDRGHGRRHPLLHPGRGGRRGHLAGHPDDGPLRLVRPAQRQPGTEGAAPGGRRQPRPASTTCSSAPPTTPSCSPSTASGAGP